MPRNKNDGRGRLGGGRKKGVQNHITADLKEWVSMVLDGEREKFVSNLKKLPPSEHVRAILTLLNYCIPKQAPINAADIIERERKMFLALMASMPDTAVSDLASKFLELNVMGDVDTVE